ncbi:retrotransposon protein putative unclassified, partial [Trifolium medium]|nr:retrotransposon protein putative unclassified [Trifolium medium]
MNPPTFEGQYEPTEASECLFRMEDMLEDLDCTPTEKVTFTTHFFRGSASNWWH